MNHVITEFSYNGDIYKIIYDNQRVGPYHVECKGEIIQSHNSEGMIKYLSSLAQTDVYYTDEVGEVVAVNVFTSKDSNGIPHSIEGEIIYRLDEVGFVEGQFVKRSTP